MADHEPAATCPRAADDAEYEATMRDACVYWTLATVTWSLSHVLEKDEEWGLLSHRQRHVFRLERLFDMIVEDERLQAIARVSQRMADTLRDRWADVDLDVPLYPAFS